MIDLATLEGQSFGPHPMRIGLEKVREFIAAVDMGPDPWTEAAPPSFISAALFVVAPDLLRLLDGYSVLHGDQSFAWNGPLGLERDVSVVGTVSRVREREGTWFVTFDLEVIDGDGGDLASGTSLFLVSASKPDPAADAPDRPAVRAEDRGFPESGQKAASRLDLVRYAGATRDWNPIHWDHDAAVQAGLTGVIAHGLLQAAWALDAAGGGRPAQRPFASAKIRFRNPLPPATPVDVVVDSSGASCDVTLERGETVFLTARVTYSEE